MFTDTLNCGVRWLAVLVATIILGMAPTHAGLLNPGATILLQPANEPLGATLLVATNTTFTAAAFAGSLASQVWNGDEANLWGGLTFCYRLALTKGSADSLGWFTLNGFVGALTDVNCSDKGFAPRLATRSTSGAEISFGFFDDDHEDGLLSSGSSAWLVIQTDSATWGRNQSVTLNSLEVAAATFAPIAIPEPAVGRLLAVVATLGMLVAPRRQPSAA